MSAFQTSFRSHNCGELNLQSVGKDVNLCGWVQGVRELGGMTFVDLRDRYGITQLVFSADENSTLNKEARKLGREDVIQARGKVSERMSKNAQITTGDIEVITNFLLVLHSSQTPPFTIEDESDGGDELRMKYRYLDLRRNPLQRNLMLRHQLARESRKYLDNEHFIEIETPCLIKSTPEGARDFIVPSRMNAGQFYALPQSPQTFKQLLMISGYDRYFQIVKCYRDEDLRADRQPEFTQIDCEMSFVDSSDIMRTFEGLVRHLFQAVLGVSLPEFSVYTYDEVMAKYGSDKPDLRFGMEFRDITKITKGKGFNVFDSAEAVIGIRVEKCAEYSRKQLDELTEFVKKPQLGGKGLVYVKCNNDGTYKSSADKFYSSDDLASWAKEFDAVPGDLLLIVSGDLASSRRVLGALRLEMADQLGLRKQGTFNALWVVDFPLFEWNKEDKRYFAMHHPFTSPSSDTIHLLEKDPSMVKANAYDVVINGVEVGGGSIRIHDSELQKKIFSTLGLSDEEVEQRFGFLINAFSYGAPPHGGIAFGFDRLCATFSGTDSIRDFIAFPKNNSGRDIMLDAPSAISKEQLDELKISLKSKSDE